MTESMEEAARKAVRQNYMGFAAISKTSGDRSFMIGLDRITDNEYEYEATYRIDNHTEDTLTGVIHKHDEDWVIEPDHETVE